LFQRHDVCHGRLLFLQHCNRHFGKAHWPSGRGGPNREPLALYKLRKQCLGMYSVAVPLASKRFMSALPVCLQCLEEGASFRKLGTRLRQLDCVRHSNRVEPKFKPWQATGWPRRLACATRYKSKQHRCRHPIGLERWPVVVEAASWK